MLIKNCKIVNSDGIEEIKDILIENGKILEISENINTSSKNVIDANENYVIPGVIDAHTHMRDPGLTYKEDAETGSMACAKGGVTTFIDMPNTIPNTTELEILLTKKEIYKNRTYVDYGFNFGGARTNNSEEIKKAKNMVAATKTFLNISTGKMVVEDEKVLNEIFEASKIVAVHAEEEMAEKAIKIANKANRPLYICHVSLGKEAEYIRNAKKNGQKVYGEVAPHHLFLNIDDLEKNEESKMMLRMKPELKTKRDNEKLWEALADGTIDTIGTDHAPHTVSEKLSQVTFGVPSVEHSLEMMLKGVDEGKISMQRLIEVMCHNPAKIFKMQNKGYLEPGFDADIVIIDRNDKSVIKEEEVVTKCAWSPFKGYNRGGRVLLTMVRGNIVYENGKFNEIKNGKEVTFYE